VNPREKSGSILVMSLAAGPAALRISASFASSCDIPPTARTPYHATAITMAIFRTN
jgi:hypothetical protein